MTAADMPDNTGNKIQFFWTQPQKKPKNDAKLKRTNKISKNHPLQKVG